MDSDNFYKNNYIKYKIKYLDIKNNLLQNGGGYSNIYVYNKLKNIIERINFNNYDNKIQVYIDDTKLVKVAKRNDVEIKKIIKSQTNYKNRFFHVSTKEFPYPFDDKKDNYTTWFGGNGVYKNPQGIWISCGLSWQNYIGNSPNSWSLATYIYEIEISDTVLHIKSLLELENFINQYMKNNPKITDIIDWKRVKENYDGLIISPYLGNKIWGKNANKFGIWGDSKEVDNYLSKLAGNKWEKNLFFTAEWYRHWEEASGVIWKPSTGIKTIKIVKKINLDYILNKK